MSKSNGPIFTKISGLVETWYITLRSPKWHCHGN